MIRTLLAISAFAAVSGAAHASDIRIDLAGKDISTIRTELGQAARLACRDVSVSDYAPCVNETYDNAMKQALKIKAAYK